VGRRRAVRGWCGQLARRIGEMQVCQQCTRRLRLVVVVSDENEILCEAVEFAAEARCRDLPPPA